MKKTEYHPADCLPRMLSKEQANNPYYVLKEFISSFGVNDMNKSISSWIKAAYKNRIWKRGSPGDLIFIREEIEILLEAAYLINTTNLRKNRFLIDPSCLGTTTISPSFYIGSENHTAWDCFPRNLSKKEFLNPYLVFRRIFKAFPLAEWRKVLQELQWSALIKDNREICLKIDLSRVHKYLQKLVEATYLIYARELSGIDWTDKENSKGNK